MDNLNDRWIKLLLQLQKDVVDDLDLKGVLFLIGVQELQMGIKDFTKEEKQDILHLAVCKLLARYGYFKFKKVDNDGWPHWEEINPIKTTSSKQQDILLKEAILDYFD